MGNILLFNSDGFNDYEFWQTHNKNTLKRINRLIKQIQRGAPLEGVGKPEKLKGTKDDFSIRIDQKNRLIFTYVKIGENKSPLIKACEGHYDHGVSKEKESVMHIIKI